MASSKASKKKLTSKAKPRSSSSTENDDPKDRTRVITRKKIDKKQREKASPNGALKRARTFHVLKRQLLAPFIVKLILRHRREEFFKDLDLEITFMDLPRVSVDGHDLTLGMATADNEDDATSINSDASHEDDWRTSIEDDSD